MDSISEIVLASHSPLLNKPPRMRKISVYNEGNMTDVDMNGNTSLRRRVSSCSEHPVQVSQLQSVLMDAITKSRESASTDARASGAWEDAFLEQIQSLIETVKVSDSLTDCINDELLENENMHENTGGRVRRKSCMAVNRSVSYKNAILGRRVSVTDREALLSQNGPRRKVSTAGLENMNFVRRNSGFAGEGRRGSVTSQSSGRRSSVVTNPAPSRRSSVVAVGRRNSFVTPGRRNSVAHAPGHGPPPLRRLSSAHNVLDNNMNHAPRRRSSVVKPSCFNVSKISSLQQRLHRIYRQRRRKQRGQVNVADVRTAMGVENCESSDSSGEISAESESDNAVDNTENGVLVSSDSEQANTIETHTDVNKTDENCNLEKANSLNCSVISIDTITHDDSSTSDSVNSENGNSQGPIPNPRRKTSIQIRSWEISRQLRQRRRLKRKSGSESDLI